MPNENLILILKDEIDRCTAEIRKVDDTVNRMQERRVCYDIQKTTLQMLLDMALKEGADNAGC